MQVIKELVWVWPDDDPEACIAASMVEYHEISIDKEASSESSSLYMREVFYPFGATVESALDSCHLHFANGKSKVRTYSTCS